MVTVERAPYNDYDIQEAKDINLVIRYSRFNNEEIEYMEGFNPPKQ